MGQANRAARDGRLTLPRTSSFNESRQPMMINFKGSMTAVLVVLCASVAVPATADAADFDVVTGGSYASLDAGASRIVFHGPSGSVPVNCNSTSAVLSAAAGTYVFNSTIGGVVPAFSDCIGPLGVDVDVNCDEADLGVGALTLLGAAGSLNSVDCEVSLPIIACTESLIGSVDIEYLNPVGATSGKLIVDSTGQSLSFSGGCAPLLPAGSVQIVGSPALGFELDPAGAPHPVIS